MALIDAHCHLADERFGDELDGVIERADRAGITGFIQGGTWSDDWDRQLELVRRYPNRVYPVFGIHPWWAAGRTDEECDEAMEKLPGYLEKGAIGLGELGLDYGRKGPAETRPRQMRVFEAQLKLGPGLPLVLHIVKAHEDALRGLRAAGPFPLGGIVHAYTGGPQAAAEYVKLGFTISVGGSVAARKGFESLKRAVVTVPPDRLVIESDSPDQPPPGWAGRSNEPASLWEVAEAVATLRGEGVGRDAAAAVLERSRRNLERIFALRK